MVTYQFQLINLNNGNSDVFKQLESNRSSPGQPCCVFVPKVSNKATSPINIHPYTYVHVQYPYQWMGQGGPVVPEKKYMFVAYDVCHSPHSYSPSTITFGALQVWTKEKKFPLDDHPFSFCAAMWIALYKPFQWFWKGVTIGLIWLHGLVKRSLPLP